MRANKHHLILIGLFASVLIVATIISIPHISSRDALHFLKAQTPSYGAGCRYDWGFMKFSGKYHELYSFPTDVNSFFAIAKNELVSKDYQVVSNNPHIAMDDGLKGYDNYFSVKSDPFTRPMINICKDCMLIEDPNLPLGQHIVRRKKSGYVTVFVKYPLSKRNEIMAAIEHLNPVSPR